MQEALIIIILTISILILVIVSLPILISIFSTKFKKTRFNKMGKSSQIRLINQLREAVEYLSKNKIGALITIENNDNIENLRTDGIIIDANISSSLLISIFNKYSPLHDGAVIIRDNKIYYASTFYKITKKSIDNQYGARHRAAMGISELCDATTIVVSEETGNIKLIKNGIFYAVKIEQFQEQLVKYLKD
ncbi:diadenylate cyclase [Mycoplasma tauri]|uniref:DNA integrity scanning protein DisA nucleotide-binding domain protein n=1 Tax=Mycoplasma tauri TaxID=547987 RepID=A0A953NGC9_9MOLU|nr:DNA integrity scanning protein DisA nucleotide-binding domain protein [Mycoplasma tauri]MBZ4195370.1 DNA integrity scanning protein DisA nucleotide-binding domain protein [Mycoplasma tauri]MBZ4203901.1 DNA integrity scanning protein DisA nucleotide-binding domain protein [Mycoplasma tauri]MBZ4204519.1 DNA integrity scanning protein DisA nucleotide-binding domain protein [Mycoplasma tauri]MBZ4212500.1 DNA integrity scanning protein DisA nucleotide-binding domain protein [Mycoplasma tauri]MBZ